jgi:hypothetical protein
MPSLLDLLGQTWPARMAKGAWSAGGTALEAAQQMLQEQPKTRIGNKTYEM